MNSGVLRMSGGLQVGLCVSGNRRHDAGPSAHAMERQVFERSNGTNRADTGLMLRVRV